MSDLVKRLRSVTRFPSMGGRHMVDDVLVDDAASLIEKLERELAEEKAMSDRLISAGANALQGDPQRDKVLVDAWDDACAVYRKARGL